MRDSISNDDHRHSTGPVTTSTSNGVSSYIYLDYIVVVAVAPVAVTASLTPKDQEEEEIPILAASCTPPRSGDRSWSRTSAI
jgi:hypothetical protein